MKTRDLKELKGIVIHRAEVAESAELVNPEYAALIFRDGSITTLAPDSTVTPSCANWNPVTLNVALFGDFATLEPGRNWTPTPEQMRSLTSWINNKILLYGNLWVSGHSELGNAGTKIPSKLCVGHECPGTHGINLDQLRAQNKWAKRLPAITADARAFEDGHTEIDETPPTTSQT